ncbi:MAG: UBP-type zinc finger domain-containing protein [Candidatus Doudnabacteria bacterium]
MLVYILSYFFKRFKGILILLDYKKINMKCTHLEEANPKIKARIPDGCEECIKSGDSWVQLRLCLSCGHVGCCDSSKNKHATKHFDDTQHPIMRSFPAGDWMWCYVDKDYVK